MRGTGGAIEFWGPTVPQRPAPSVTKQWWHDYEYAYSYMYRVQATRCNLTAEARARSLLSPREDLMRTAWKFGAVLKCGRFLFLTWCHLKSGRPRCGHLTSPAIPILRLEAPCHDTRETASTCNSPFRNQVTRTRTHHITSHWRHTF